MRNLQVGLRLPEEVIPVTVPLVTGGAIATRDYFPGHHDLEAARALGSPHIFMNILTTNGLVQRYVENWAGETCVIHALRIKLGMPNYPGDQMTLSGEVKAFDASTGRYTIEIKGRNGMGNHVTGTVDLSFQGAKA
ncbi:MaoC-like dehydratase domain containing protein [Burkholderiales bacterium]